MSSLDRFTSDVLGCFDPFSHEFGLISAPTPWPETRRRMTTAPPTTQLSTLPQDEGSRLAVVASDDDLSPAQRAWADVVKAGSAGAVSVARWV